MTYEEFRHRALNPLMIDAPSVFIVEAVGVDIPPDDLWSEEAGHTRHSYYPQYRICRRYAAFAGTLAEAEALIGKEVEKSGDMERDFCYYVTEKPSGVMFSADIYFSRRVYAADGKPLERAYCHNWRDVAEWEEMAFHGHPEDALRFRKGDIVEVRDGDAVRLAVVVDLPYSIERCWKRWQRDEERGTAYCLDNSEDSYAVIDGPGNTHLRRVSTLDVFAPHFPIPTRTRRRLKGYFYAYADDRAYDRESDWKRIMKLDFEDLAVLHKGKDGLKADLRLDGFRNYLYTGHKPCVYFRNGEGENDFLPMIIADKPYVPYPFKLAISEEDFSWVVDWVRTNKTILLGYADGEMGYKAVMSLLKMDV